MQSDRAIYLPQQNHLYSPSFPPNKMSTVNLTLRLSPSFLKLILHVCMDFIPSSYSLILIPLLPKKKKMYFITPSYIISIIRQICYIISQLKKQYLNSHTSPSRFCPFLSSLHRKAF